MCNELVFVSWLVVWASLVSLHDRIQLTLAASQVVGRDGWQRWLAESVEHVYKTFNRLS